MRLPKTFMNIVSLKTFDWKQLWVGCYFKKQDEINLYGILLIYGVWKWSG